MGKYQPKISVIIPVYGVEKYIRQCLDSVINQTYKNLEIIIVNDGTKDNSMKIVEEYLDDERIKVINKENGGLSSARNRGMEEATGEYISFVDSDDWLDLKMYEELCSQINNENILIYRFFNYDDKKNKILKEKKLDSYFKNNLTENKYIYAKLPYSCWSKLYRREYLEKNKFKFLEILYEDVFWNLQTIFLTKKIKFINKKYYFYRVNRDNSIMKMNKEAKEIKNIEFQKKQEKAYKTIYANIAKFIKLEKEKLSKGESLYLLLELKYWQIYTEGKISIVNINKDIKEKNNFSKIEREVLYKRFKEIIQNNDLKKIEGLNIFDIFYWQNKIFTLKFLKRKIRGYI